METSFDVFTTFVYCGFVTMCCLFRKAAKMPGESMISARLILQRQQ